MLMNLKKCKWMCSYETVNCGYENVMLWLLDVLLVALHFFLEINLIFSKSHLRYVPINLTKNKIFRK